MCLEHMACVETWREIQLILIALSATNLIHMHME